MTVNKRKVFLGTFVHCKALDELEFLHGAAVCVDECGTIAAVERECGLDRVSETVLPRLGWDANEVEVMTAREGQFFFPGFIDTHIHASQYPNTGIFGKSTLLDWLNTYTFPLEASLADPAKARRVYARVVRRTLAHGTTCAAYYATVDVASTNLLADLCLAAGQRALVGRVCMDSEACAPDYYRDESPAAAIAATRACVEHVRAVDPDMKLVRPVVTPRFAPACSAELMRALGELARDEELPVQTHVSENEGEIALVRELFFPESDRDNNNNDNNNNNNNNNDLSSSYAAVYDAAGLLTPRTILAHAVHLTEAEAALVAARGAKVSHCPCSNSALTSGAARVRWLLDRGVACGLGTDVSGGFSPSVLVAARQAALVSRHVAMGTKEERDKLSVEEVLFLATRGGAEVVGLAGRVGGFEVGMEWDAQLVGLGTVDERGEEGEGDGGDVDVFGWESWEDRIAKWVYTGDDRNTKKVWVRGRLVHERS